jgi:cytochrome c oxidase subunit I+III
MHGTVMMFLFAMPIFEAFSIFVLPQMLGRARPALPPPLGLRLLELRLGGAFFCGSLFFNVAPRGGWFMYPPLTTRVLSPASAPTSGCWASFIEIAAIAGAVELIVGVLKCRRRACASTSSRSTPGTCWWPRR